MNELAVLDGMKKMIETEENRTGEIKKEGKKGGRAEREGVLRVEIKRDSCDDWLWSLDYGSPEQLVYPVSCHVVLFTELNSLGRLRNLIGRTECCDVI